MQGEHSVLARNLSPDEPAEAARGHIAGEVAAAEGDDSPLSVCLVGPGWRFTSGISYYTCRLANSMADDQCDTSVILLRRLLPRLLYPGKARVGLKRASMQYAAGVSVFDGIDWWWGTSLARALRFLRSRRPKVLVLQWWTVATLHTYLLLAVAARLTGMRVVIELHELQDPGEAGLALARGYGRWGLRALIRLAHGAIVHSKSDWQLFESNYGPMDMRVALVPHGPYDQYRYVPETADPAITAAITKVRTAPKSDGTVNLLFFGLIRPYKGLEDLIRVFNAAIRAHRGTGGRVIGVADLHARIAKADAERVGGHLGQHRRHAGAEFLRGGLHDGGAVGVQLSAGPLSAHEERHRVRGGGHPRADQPVPVTLGARRRVTVLSPDPRRAALQAFPQAVA